MTEDEEGKKAAVDVAEDQLSLAIGKGGQNARLAAKLTGWKIDIKGIQGESFGMDTDEVMDDEDGYTSLKDLKTVTTEAQEALIEDILTGNADGDADAVEKEY